MGQYKKHGNVVYNRVKKILGNLIYVNFTKKNSKSLVFHKKQKPESGLLSM